jgi:GNAT superfamily N-acetyltransferase
MTELPTAEEIDSLRAAIGWGPGSWLLGPLVETGGLLVSRRSAEDALLAMGGSARFGNVGFICNMVVHPEWKRRGLGRAIFEDLLARLDSHGVRDVQLEATSEGAPLYAQYGFRPRWESIGGRLTQDVAPFDDPGVRPIEDADWDTIGQLDRESYGGERLAFLRAIARSPRCRKAVRLVEGGSLRGFAMAFEGRVGPVVARDAEAAQRLARAVLQGAEVGTVAAIGHPQHATFWEPLGVEVSPYDLRMARGGEPQDRPEQLFCMLTGGVG